LSTTLRPLPFLLALAACGGTSAPPPPVATATPSRTADDLRPMSSRESAAHAGAPAGPVDASAPLPAGHPPVEGAPAQAASLPSGHPPIGEPAPGAKSAGSVTGTIALSPKLKVGPSDVMYIMAKNGSATLAVRRIEKPSFPFAFEITGGDAMMSGGAFEGRPTHDRRRPPVATPGGLGRTESPQIKGSWAEPGRGAFSSPRNRTPSRGRGSVRSLRSPSTTSRSEDRLRPSAEVHPCACPWPSFSP
jgi:hypothetical protein